MENQGRINGAGGRYRAGSAEAVLAYRLDDITVLYHRASGQTHMVISPVPEIMEALTEAGDATVEDVHASLSRNYELGDMKEATVEIAAHLEGLVALGLAQRG